MTLLETGRIQPATLETELADVLAGRAAGREDDEEICIFASAGNPLWDTFVGRWALARVREAGAGRETPFWEGAGEGPAVPTAR